MDPLKGEILIEGTPDPEARDVTPGWVARNRGAIERARNIARAMIVPAPPPVRIALGAATVAADALLLADDMRRRGEDREVGVLRAGALVLEGAAVLAVSRFAPARLAANLAGIEAARRMFEHAARRESTP
ncbi:MAG: hypothetical protein AAFR79_11390 [Pseudomonadota bacterium]